MKTHSSADIVHPVFNGVPRNANPTPHHAGECVVEEWLQSNLCRCTSYQEIRNAVKAMYKKKPN